jgi:anti-sigma factor RsiW
MTTRTPSDALSCRDAQPLVGAYVDGELSESQASPLRQHLLACQACRASAQDLKSLKRWFAPGKVASQTAIPSGFAARVTRRAFAGDTGERREELARTAPVPAPSAGAALAAPSRQRSLHSLVLTLTGVAAAAAIVAALAIQAQKRPTGRDLRADDRALQSTEEILDRLEALNRAEEAAGAESGSSPSHR